MKGNKIAASVLSAAICVSSSLPVSALADNSVNVKYETKNVNLVNAENTETTTKAVTTTTAKATSTTTTAKATTTTSKAAATTAKATTTTKAAATTTAKATTTTAKAETTAVKTETTTAKPTTTTAAATTTTAATTVVTTTAPPTYDLGDPTGDGIIDATDASFILTDYANTSVDKESEMNEQQKLVSDVNRDGVVDASDASVVLTYYSYTSVNGNIDFRDYLTKPAETTTTTAPATTTTTTTTTSATTTTTAETTTAVTTTTADIYTVSSITVTPSSVEIGVGGVQTVYAKFFPATASDKSERWETSDNSIAVVDKYGKITGIAPGKCKITVISVSNPEISADVEVTVKGNGSVSPTDTAESIKLTKSELNLAVGASEKVYATVLPSTADGSVRWESSDPSAVKVDQYGTVTALKPGKCVITVFSTQNQKITAELIVNAEEKEVSPDDIYTVQAIELSKTEMTLNVGQRDLSYVTIVPQTATDWGEIWSTSDPNIATVDREGYVTAVAPGVCFVTVTSRQNPNVSRNIVVTVKENSSSETAVQSIQLSKYDINLGVGGKAISIVTMLPTTANDQSELWTTSNPNVATVDEQGWITGLNPGSCIVTVQSRSNPKVFAEIRVTVVGSSQTGGQTSENTRVTGISLSKNAMSLSVGGTDISYVTMTPANAANKEEIWISSNPNVATVDKYGYVTGVSEGNCVITVRSEDNPNVKATVSVVVSGTNAYSSDDNAVMDIKLSKTYMGLNIGEKDISYVTMLPENATNKDEVWSSSDTNVAVVDNLGWVTAKGPGSCMITVRSKSNPGVYKMISVMVPPTPYKAPKTPDVTTENGVTYVDGILIANKTYALPSTYNPGGLLPEVMAQFSKLAAAAKKDGLNIYISSGFRSYLTQQSIYNNNVYYYGTAKTDTFSARPGHSEHQTGLAMDVNTISDAFIGTPEAIWLAEHAQEYGFIIRYPKGKENITGYKYEPWHLRYLGVETAEDVYMSGLCLEEYLGIDSAYRS